MTGKGICRLFPNKTLFLVALAAAFLSAPLFCESAASSADRTWVLAARKFDVEGSPSKSAESAAALLPKLILERISVGMERDVLPEERAARKGNELLTERLDLFLQLAKECKARDSLVLNNYTNLEFEMALAEAQKKIKTVQDKIDKNLETQESVLRPERGRRRAPRRAAPGLERQTELVALYKDDSESLFAASAEAEREGVRSRKYQKEVSAAKINALVSGTISFYGDYLSARVELLVFPDARESAALMEVGSLGQIGRVAENISFALLPRIANGLPVELEFSLSPKAALSKTVLTIDNIVYDPMPQKAVVSAGFHSVSLEAEGFTREAFVYNFSGRRRFFIEANLKKSETAAAKLVLSRFTPGDIFFDGKYAGPSSKTDYVDVPLKVNGDTVFGYFESELVDKRRPENSHVETMFMQIPRSLMFDGSELEANVKVVDLSRNIDRRRKMMYLSYSALMISLPFFFYTYGRFVASQRALQTSYGSVSSEEYDRYRQLSFLGMGITAACGVWFVAELVAYLVAVDKTLPPKAKKVGKRTECKMQDARALSGLEEMMRAEAESISPLMPERKDGGGEGRPLGPELNGKD